MTLFEKFDGVISDELVENLKGLSDRNLGDSKGAIYAIFYTMLAGLIRRANSDMSTGMLVNQIKKINTKDYSELDLETASSKKEKLKDFVQAGEKNMSQIFPSFKSQLMNLVVIHSGTSKAESSKYAGFVNSFIIKVLSKKLQEGMDKHELMNYLKEHRDPLFENAPANLVEKMIPAMGMHELRTMKMTYAKKVEEREKKEMADEEVEYVESTTDAESSSYDFAEESKKSFKIPIIIVLGVALVGLLGYFIYESREDLFGSEEMSQSSVVNEELVNEIDSTAVLPVQEGPAVDPAITAFNEIISASDLSNGDEVRVESLSFVADSIELSNPQNAFVDTLFNEFSSNPRFQIQIKGHHSGGDTQVAIRRAFYLKRMLQSKGVDPIKIDAISDPEKIDYLKIRVVSK
ncbi:hypothetical protein [Jiulongibacter sediminis]|jgi:hypothetical protein|uniref:hypothetical protein n=1 Tax=Jiulongibacter sediminis TaxID=1605367 RepID=UPI0026F01DE8|nr:hypothetical protein [Jiulongibacter sediminis]